MLPDSAQKSTEFYIEAFKISTKGYSVILRRDVSETMINNYNSEWIKAWSGNMDLQVCLDFFAVITYITDYYLKDETGTLKFIQQALEGIKNEKIKAKMNTVKNTFITKRQTGECEIYYKMLPFLHLSQSNISTEFIPTGFRKNRSRFLKQITSDLANRLGQNKVIEVEGKEGKNYLEKENVIDKYVRRPACFQISLA